MKTANVVFGKPFTISSNHALQCFVAPIGRKIVVMSVVIAFTLYNFALAGFTFALIEEPWTGGFGGKALFSIFRFVFLFVKIGNWV